MEENALPKLNPPDSKSEPSQQIEGTNPSGFFSESSNKGSISVRVAVRVRPLLPKELAAGESSCIQCDTFKNNVLVGLDKSFTFDKVFDTDTKQQEIFDTCVKNLVLGSFAGYNSTVLAYGQTGSGKTFTMGTDVALASSKDQQGIIPRVIQTLFSEVEKRKANTEFIIKVSFIEIYNEEIRDLLDPQGQSKIIIRELTRGIPSLCGQREERVIDYDSIFKLLETGAIHRRTRSTLMNESSSRSHAIFTINIEQHLIEDLYQNNNKDPSDSPASAPTVSVESQNSPQEFTTAKFHFVDLAGSERIKKTGAEGDSMHEGISINKALFVLGKVINALTDDTGKTTYKPYRESNLTRILQDSLGGNARTTMIACVSPIESSHEETLSTLLYACKARSIKNKPVINRDPNTTLIHQLQQQVYDLQRELTRYKKPGSVPLPLKSMPEISAEPPSDRGLKAEISFHKRENENLKKAISELEEKCRKNEIEILQAKKEQDLAKLENEKLREFIKKIATPEQNAELNQNLSNLTNEMTRLEEYKKQLLDTQNELKKKTDENTILQQKYTEECKTANFQSEQLLKLNQELYQLKRTLVKIQKEKNPHISNSVTQSKTSLKHTDSENPTISKDGPWLSNELNEQLMQAQEIFINELTQSLGNLLPTEQATPQENQISSETPEEFSETPEIEEEIKKEENPIEKETQATLNKVDGDIHEREKMLEQIKEKHKEMQKNLIAIMEQQYHKKVEELEKEMEKLKSDQEKAIQLAPKDNKLLVETQYKKKIGDYENKIKEFRKNEANQQKLLKQANEHESKISVLTEEINKMKQQKIELTRQMRKERENYEKMRREQLKESMKLKQETIKQKLIITKLTKEKERAIKIKETAKISPTKNILPTAGFHKELVEGFTNRLVEIRQEALKMQKEEQKQSEIKKKLDEEYNEVGKLKIELEKHQIIKKELNNDTEYDKIVQIDTNIEKMQKQLIDHQANIDNLESTLRYHEEKVIKIEQSSIQLKTQLAKYFSFGTIS